MRIEYLRIENLRTFQDVTVPFDPYTCFVGANGAGKSTVLLALNILFRDSSGTGTDVALLSEQDFHKKDTQKPIRITATFCDLSVAAKEDFRDYVRHDKLVILAEANFDHTSGAASVKQHGIRAVMAEFAGYFEAESAGSSAADLKAIFAGLREKFPEVAAGATKDAMRQALRDYESAHPERCVLLPSEDQFYGVSKGANRLAKYIQWVYVPAVKNASDEQQEGKNTALGRLLARTVRATTKFDDELEKLKAEAFASYQQILDRQQAALSNLEEQLAGRLAEWAHPDATLRLTWLADPRKSVQIDDPIARAVAGEGGFEGDIARFGHGLQRSYLLALLQVLASSADDDAPTLILGCEEPELYQHPPQARHLAEVLQSLSGKNAQILVTTHNPLFVSGEFFEQVRLVRKDTTTRVSDVGHIRASDVATSFSAARGKPALKPMGQVAKLHQLLQPSLNEMFFAPRIVLVEGLEDLAYINSWMMLTGRWEAFRKGGFHVVPAHCKSNLAHPIIVAKTLGIPHFVVFDSDSNDEKHRGNHKVDNVTLLNLIGGDSNDPFPAESIITERYAVWSTNFGEAFSSAFDPAHLQALNDRASAALGNPGGLEKNSLHIAQKLEFAIQDGVRPACLEALCEKILGLP
jgi:putative ATP-dependent endonuclease of OLD family